MGPDFTGSYRKDLPQYDVTDIFARVVKYLLKDLRSRNEIWISTDPGAFRGIVKTADSTLDGKDKANDYMFLLINVGVLFEDTAEKRFYCDVERLRSLADMARANNRLPRFNGLASKRLAELKQMAFIEKTPETSSVQPVDQKLPFKTIEEAAIVVQLFEEENSSINQALEKVKSERDDLQTANRGLTVALRNAQADDEALSAMRIQLEAAQTGVTELTTKYAVDMAQKQREVESAEQASALHQGKCLEAEQKLASSEALLQSEKARADELQKKLESHKPELFDAAKRGLGDIAALVRYLSREGGMGQASSTPPPAPAAAPPAVKKDGIQVEEIARLIEARSKFVATVTEKGMEIQEELAELKEDRKEAEAQQRSGVTQADRVKGQIDLKTIDVSIEVLEKYYSDLMLVRRKVMDEQEKLVAYLQSVRAANAGAPEIQPLPELPKRPKVAEEPPKVEKAESERFRNEAMRLAQVTGYGPHTVMLASLYEISPRSAGGRAVFTVPRMLRAANHCGLIVMNEQQMKDAEEAFSREYSREKLAPLLKSAVIPNVQRPMYQRTQQVLPWKVDDLLTPAMKTAYAYAVELMAGVSGQGSN